MESILIHVLWTVLFLTVFYYFLIENVELKVTKNGVHYLNKQYVNAVRPFFLEMPNTEREKYKINFKPEKPKTPIKKGFFEGSYGKMRIIIIVVSVILGISLYYFIKTKNQKMIDINIMSIIIALAVVFTEFVFSNFVTPGFMNIDSNETLSYVFQEAKNQI